MTPLKQVFYVHEICLGETTRKLQRVHGELQTPVSYAYVCPECGNLWAKAVVRGGVSPFRPLAIACSLHQGHSLAPAGSLWLPWDTEYTNAFPEGILRRELQIHLQLYDESLDYVN